MCNCHSILECCVMFSGVKVSIRSFNLLLGLCSNMAKVSRLGPSYQIVADPKFIKQTWISLTECCEKFGEMVYNCSHFMQQMLPQVDV